MPRFYRYDELVIYQPMSRNDILRLAGQISKLPPFSEGVAVLCGSAAWGQPSWRSDIDVVTFRTEAFPDISPAIDTVISNYRETAEARFLLPKTDVILVGAESQQLVTRENLVRGSTPITEMRTIREVFAATSLRFFDHIGSLAAAKGGSWRRFHSAYLAQVSRDQNIRLDEIRTYVASFADSWRQQPLRSLHLNPSRNAHHSELEMMSFAENFPIHLMRQILAERGSYPSPDRAPDVRTAFAHLSQSWAENLLRKLTPFLEIGEKYAEIVSECRSASSEESANEYYRRLTEIFEALPFADIEEAVWDYLRCTA
jgi:hypothetical protein